MGKKERSRKIIEGEKKKLAESKPRKVSEEDSLEEEFDKIAQEATTTDELLAVDEFWVGRESPKSPNSPTTLVPPTTASVSTTAPITPQKTSPPTPVTPLTKPEIQVTAPAKNEDEKKKS